MHQVAHIWPVRNSDKKSDKLQRQNQVAQVSQGTWVWNYSKWLSLLQQNWGLSYMYTLVLLIPKAVFKTESTLFQGLIELIFWNSCQIRHSKCEWWGWLNIATGNLFVLSVILLKKRKKFARKFCFFGQKIIVAAQYSYYIQLFECIWLYMLFKLFTAVRIENLF